MLWYIIVSSHVLCSDFYNIVCRQEHLSMEAKLANLECRSRETLLQQGAAISGASVALSRLGARLDNLVDTLVTSYNISEQDLEVRCIQSVVYRLFSNLLSKK